MTETSFFRIGIVQAVNRLAMGRRTPSSLFTIPSGLGQMSQFPLRGGIKMLASVGIVQTKQQSLACLDICRRRFGSKGRFFGLDKGRISSNTRKASRNDFFISFLLLCLYGKKRSFRFSQICNRFQCPQRCKISGFGRKPFRFWQRNV